jgi:hypothetical protein
MRRHRIRALESGLFGARLLHVPSRNSIRHFSAILADYSASRSCGTPRFIRPARSSSNDLPNLGDKPAARLSLGQPRAVPEIKLVRVFDVKHSARRVKQRFRRRMDQQRPHRQYASTPHHAVNRLSQAGQSYNLVVGGHPSNACQVPIEQTTLEPNEMIKARVLLKDIKLEV